MGRLIIIDEIEGFLFRIGRWSEAYKMRAFHCRENREDARQGASIYAGQHEHSGGGAEQPRLLRRDPADPSTSVDVEGEGARQEHPDTLASMNNLAFRVKQLRQLRRD